MNAMNISSKSVRSILSAAALAVTAGAPLAAQDFYDDIYYDPRTDDKPAVQQPAMRQHTPVVAADYPSADTYQLSAATGAVRDVDEYNRRGIFADGTQGAQAPADSLTDFACTRRIERFYNPDVIVASDDPTLAQVYYAQPSEVNIIVNNPGGYWGWGYNPYVYTYGWYGSPSWYWSSWGGPYWSWSWGFTPGWGPGWGWGWDWAYGPGWGAYPPPPGGHHRPFHGNNRHPGALGRPSFGGGHMAGNRPSTGARPGATRHPGVSGATVARPGQTSGGFRPSTGMRPSTTSRPSHSSGYRPGAVNGGSHRQQPSTVTRPTQTVNRHTTSTVTRQQSSPSYNRGSSSGGGFRNGGGRSGGGGGRGRH